jgi:hypothetical protein
VAALIYSPPRVGKVSFSPVSSTAFIVVSVINDSHSNWSEVKSQCCFDLHFLSGQGS